MGRFYLPKMLSVSLVRFTGLLLPSAAPFLLFIFSFSLKSKFSLTMPRGRLVEDEEVLSRMGIPLEKVVGDQQRELVISSGGLEVELAH